MSTASTSVIPAAVEQTLLLHSADGGVATLRLNRPDKYNALSKALLEALQTALDDIAKDAAIRVVVIAGEGAAFCAGHDLKEMQEARDAVSGINVGLFCSTPAVALSRNLSRKHALDMLLTGEFIDAQTTLAYGLINRIARQSELAATVRQLSDAICAKSPLAVATGKRMFYQQLAMNLEDAYAYASETMACNMDSADAREGIDAFMAKRKPQWRGC